MPSLLKYLKPLYLIFISCALSFKIFEVFISSSCCTSAKVLLGRPCFQETSGLAWDEWHKKYPSDQHEKVRQLRLEKKYTSSLILPCCYGPLREGCLRPPWLFVAWVLWVPDFWIFSLFLYHIPYFVIVIKEFLTNEGRNFVKVCIYLKHIQWVG